MQRDSQLWSYTSPNARIVSWIQEVFHILDFICHFQELRNRASQNLRNSQPEQDVDNAFDFLESYSSKEE